MNLHEYQSKDLLRTYGLRVPEGVCITSANQVATALAQINHCQRWVVKAQIHAGGRGKAGGVKLVDSADAVAQAVDAMLGTRLVTKQTDATGQPVDRVLIEEVFDIAQELYFGITLDRALMRPVIMACIEGGVDIEEVAASRPELICTEAIDPLVGVMPYQSYRLGRKLNLNKEQLKQFSVLCKQLGKLFIEKDLSLLELNPLVISQTGDLICLDCKISLDENAMFRHSDLLEQYDSQQQDAREREAAEWDLSYVALDGDIGCMVNGAGLAMATMDAIKLNGGSPANFLDVGGGVTCERVIAAMRLMLNGPPIKAILINIFGGIVRCDLIARGIIDAIGQLGDVPPIVVRLEGTLAEEATVLFAQSDLKVTMAKDLADAVESVVALAGGQS